jgi:hypothetical protein
MLQIEHIEQSVQAVQSFRRGFLGLSFGFLFAAPTATASTMRSVTRNVTAASSRGTFTIFPLSVSRPTRWTQHSPLRGGGARSLGQIRRPSPAEKRQPTAGFGDQRLKLRIRSIPGLRDCLERDPGSLTFAGEKRGSTSLEGPKHFAGRGGRCGGRVAVEQFGRLPGPAGGDKQSGMRQSLVKTARGAQ